MRKTKPAQGAFALVVAPKTGEVLAMATNPNFDLNQPFEITNQETLDAIAALPQEQQSKAKSEALMKLWKNKAVTDAYEPGSVFKILTYAMALEEGVAQLSDTFTCTAARRLAHIRFIAGRRRATGMKRSRKGCRIHATLC